MDVARFIHVAFIRTTLALAILAGLALTSMSPAVAGGPSYTAANLGALTNNISQANAVNNAGEVVGFSATAASLFDGFSWQSGTMTDLGTLPGGQFSFAYGINNSGAIAGTASDNVGNYHAIVWQNGQMVDLGFLSGGSQASAMAINDSGTVAGYAYDSSNSSHAVVWQLVDGVYQITDLGTFAGLQSSANAINNAGAVTGWYTDAAGNGHGFMWQNGTETDLGDLGGGQSYGEAINSAGLVVGQSLTTSGDWHAFMWQNGQMTDLGALDGVLSGAFGVNDSNVIVGESSSPDGTDHAVLWQNGAIVDLGSYVGQNSYADGVNDAGQIVGQGNMGAFAQAFLLTPVPQAPPATPPVTTAALSGNQTNKSGWYTGPVTVTLTATDTGGPGVADTYYTLDGGSQETYSAPFVVTGDGVHTLSYWSVDTAGDAETAHSLTIEIDTTPPVTTAQLSGTLGNNAWYTGPVTITLNAQDSTSGVALTRYHVDCEKPAPYSSPVTVFWCGEHVVHYHSVDVAGNKEAVKETHFKIDSLPPLVVANGSAKSQSSGMWKVTITGEDGDWVSGLVSPIPSFTVSENGSPVSPTSVSLSHSGGCFQIQFLVSGPSSGSSSGTGKGVTASCTTGTGQSGSGQSSSASVTVALQVQNKAGLTGSTTVHVAL